VVNGAFTTPSDMNCAFHHILNVVNAPFTTRRQRRQRGSGGSASAHAEAARASG
jgi:hypothetical protein